MAEPPLDYRRIDDLIHGRVRLAIMAYLSGAEAADFATLREKTGVTDGNLSTHLSKLEQAGYVRLDKQFRDKRPLTTVHLSEAGRDAWIEYLDRMRGLLFDE